MNDCEKIIEAINNLKECFKVWGEQGMVFAKSNIDSPLEDVKVPNLEFNCSCEDGIDSKACAGCEQSEDGKPEEEKWIAYLARAPFKGKYCYLTACLESRWGTIQKEYGAKKKLFVGSYDEAVDWYKDRQKFTDVIKAWEDGKTIQVYETLFKRWGDCAGTLEWYTDCEYRVKPDCPCEDGKRKYKPYATVDEFIQDFQERFPTAFPRPAHTMPLIWIKTKLTDAKFLVTSFIPDSDDGDYVEVHGYNCNMDDLLEYYVYLDGSPVGMEEKE